MKKLSGVPSDNELSASRNYTEMSYNGSRGVPTAAPITLNEIDEDTVEWLKIFTYDSHLHAVDGLCNRRAPIRVLGLMNDPSTAETI